MSETSVLVDLPDVIAAWLKLPERGGTVRGEITAVEVRPSGDAWVKVRIPTWCRWSTQLRVGQRSHEGLAPGTTEVWAPSDAVEVEDPTVDSAVWLLRERLRRPATA
jgi:hypothetical protein